MIRIFHTASGAKKTSDDSVFKVRNIAFIIISQNSLKMALNICEGMFSGKKKTGGSEISDLTFFIEKEKKELIFAAQKSLSGFNFKNSYINISIGNYEKLSANFLDRLFKKFDCIVFFLALGAVVRLIAPFVKDKLSDPGVIIIDEAGKFAVSLLSGHTGGANKFAALISGFLGAVPVVTTATDATNMFSLDMFAERFNFFIEDVKTKVKIFNKASLDGEKFEIFIENDFKLREIKSYLEEFSNAKDFNFINELNILKLNPAKIIAVSMRDDLKKIIPEGNIAILMPRRLVVGIGCNKNTSFEEIEDFILSKFDENNLSVNAIRNAATIDLKIEEKGILRFGEKYAEFIDFFTKEEINDFIKDFKEEKNEKSLCFKYTGAYSVSEPCAVLSAKNKTGELLIYKQKKGNVTIAVAVTE